MNSKTKFLTGFLVIGIILLSGCVKKPDVTTTTTIEATTTTLKSGVHPGYCVGDSDCVPEQCCHPTSCINKKFAPDCRGIGCTMVCQGPIDCGAGRCACINNKCVVESLKPTSPEVLVIPSVSAKEVENPKLKMTSFYSLEGLEINLNSPMYQLPLNLEEIVNLQKINSRFKLKDGQKSLLKKNGFTVIPYGGDDIVEPYEDLKQREIPIFITSDSLLHLYHIQFNEILKGIEEREFFDKITDLSLAMLRRSEQDYNSFTDPELKEAARRNVAYFTVALKLLQTPSEDYDEEEVKREIEEWNKRKPWDKKTFQPIRKLDFEVRDYVKDDVEKEIRYIEEHEGFNPSPVFNSNPDCNCLMPQCYCEDYSQYIPRGHYTRSERLKRYFKSMMWYGRIAFLLKGGDDALVSDRDAKLATMQASLITAEIPAVQVKEDTVQGIWDRIYSVTAFFVGTADDLTPYEYLDAIEKVYGTEFRAVELNDEEKLLNLKAELAGMRSPEIYGGSGVCVIYPPYSGDELDECLSKTKGLRFMGQRFIPDSYMFQHLVNTPNVGWYTGSDEPFTMCVTGAGPTRCFPRGLDVMAVLGSKRAEEILVAEGDTEYGDMNVSYTKKLSELRKEFSEVNTMEWNRNLYWSWLYSLKPLLTDFGSGYPTFMQTEAWQDKELNTVLASWTELRHDTILYAKQSYTMTEMGMPPEPKPVVGYVEPVPEFYARMLALTRMTNEGLTDLNVLTKEEKSRLNNLEGILDRLLQISKDELENKELRKADYAFIRDFGENLQDIVVGVEAKGKETTLVADVHTDTNTMKVVEEGVGYVDLILVAYKVPDGRVIVGAGPVLSYYEFKHPMDDRLTDEKWKELLKSEEKPDKPKWTESFYSNR